MRVSETRVEADVVVPHLEEVLLSVVEVYDFINLVIIVVVHPLSRALAVVLRLTKIILKLQQEADLEILLSGSRAAGFCRAE